MIIGCIYNRYQGVRPSSSFKKLVCDPVSPLKRHSIQEFAPSENKKNQATRTFEQQFEGIVDQDKLAECVSTAPKKMVEAATSLNPTSGSKVLSHEFAGKEVKELEVAEHELFSLGPRLTTQFEGLESLSKTSYELTVIELYVENNDEKDKDEQHGLATNLVEMLNIITLFFGYETSIEKILKLVVIRLRILNIG